MKRRTTPQPDIDWKTALGATYSLPIGNATVLTPVDVLALREEILARIRSSGGRPTDQTWTIERQVPFREEVWKALQEISDRLRDSGAGASPAQIAALLIERCVAAIHRPARPRTKRGHREEAV